MPRTPGDTNRDALYIVAGRPAQDGPDRASVSAYCPMRTITLEEHFVTPEFLEGPGKKLKEQAAVRDAQRPGGPASRLLEQLCDLGDKRLAEMDAAHIDRQVLSITAPGVEQLPAAEAVGFARRINDHLAAAVRRHPDRFGGFAALPTADPHAAARELERAIKDCGFEGAVINGHIRGRYLDDPFFWPIFEQAQTLHAPIYIHPTPPPQPVIEASYSGFSPMINEMLAGPGWGWHIETAVHIIRIILGGAFDRYPDLQLIVGHMGETLPFMLQRVDVMPMALTKLQKPISSYLRENIHYTFSGFNFTPTFLDLLLQVGVDRIMFSADYPFASMPEARGFLDRLPVSDADRERIAHANAEKLFAKVERAQTASGAREL